MKVSTLALLAAFGVAASAPVALAERPDPATTTCDELPNGFCHRRTSKDRAFVKKWNEDQLAKKPGKGGGSQRVHGNLRSLANVVGLPDYVPNAPGEYEAVEGILLAFDGSPDGRSSYDLDVVAGIAAGVTNQQATATKVYMASNVAQKAVWEAAFLSAGVNMNLVVWINETIDSVWIRDYGPRFICDPDTSTRAAVDTKYYTGRPNDEKLPIEISNADRLDHDNFDLNAIMHSGGNAHYFSDGKAFATSLLQLDNQALTEQDFKDRWAGYKGVDLTLTGQLSFNVDGTGHIDMWFLPVSNNAVIIGQFEGKDQYGSKALMDSTADFMAGQGYKVYRTPNWTSKKGNFGYTTHYTYTNAVIANDVVVISKFNQEPEDTTALNVFEQAFPDKAIVQVNSENIIKRSGALHCIAQHVYDCGAAPGPTPPGPTRAPTPSCTDAADCPVSTSPCQVAVCDSGTCGFGDFCAGGGTCDEGISNCSQSADCSYPGCNLTTGPVSCNFSDETSCNGASGCSWQKGNGPSAGCNASGGASSVCTGTPATGPVCV